MSRSVADPFALRCRVAAMSALLALLFVLTCFYGSPDWVLILGSMFWAHSVLR